MVVGALSAMMFFILTILAWIRRKKASRLFFVLFLISFFVFVAGFGSLEIEELEKEAEEQRE